jgi:hypothetical protein
MARSLWLVRSRLNARLPAWNKLLLNERTIATAEIKKTTTAIKAKTSETPRCEARDDALRGEVGMCFIGCSIEIAGQNVSQRHGELDRAVPEQPLVAGERALLFQSRPQIRKQRQLSRAHGFFFGR